MKTTTTLTFTALLAVALPACDDADDLGITERSQPSLRNYQRTRTALALEGAGGDLQWIQFIGNNVADDPASMQFIDVDAPASCDGEGCTLAVANACLEERFGRDLAAQQAALDAFVADSQERFGVNIADPSHYLVLPYTAREDVGIRAVAMSGLATPGEGFPVHDCGLQAVGIDGVSIPLVHGSYLIEAWANPGHALPVVLDFRLREPLIQAVGHGTTPVTLGRYNITSSLYGEGIAEFVAASECDGDLDPLYGVCLGTVHHNVRNAITFSERGGL
jgi:hypothetical protein